MNKLNLEDDFYFYRCSRCQSLITILAELASKKTGDVCPCGSKRYSPTTLLWYEWLYPRVWAVVFAKLTGRLSHDPA